jgi:hypothetical protein
MAQQELFDAIDKQDIVALNRLIANRIDLNTLSLRGAALYHSVKLHNFEMTRLLVECGADCNTVQRDFAPSRPYATDGLHYSCAIYTPIDLLCRENNPEHDEILKYLLENRSMVSEDMMRQRIGHCQSLIDGKNDESFFNYFASGLLRKNIYDLVLLLGDEALNILQAAFHSKDLIVGGKPLNEGGTHEVFFVITIRSFFEQLVRFQLHNGSNIELEDQYAYILRELVRSTEAYNLLTYIYGIPNDRAEMFYPSIVKNIINKLKKMGVEEEYTLPMRWEKHAVCLNFVRKPDSIVIRIDNLHCGEIEKHRAYHNENGFLVLIPAIIGEILLNQLDQKENYFLSLLRCMKENELPRDKGIETLYENPALIDLDTNRV